MPSKIRDWNERWTERLYWQGFLVLTILVVLGYVSLSFALTGEVNLLIALFLTLGFPLSIMAYHARRSPRVGRVVYPTMYLIIGASVGALASTFLLFLIAILFRTVTGMTIPAVSVIPALALGAVLGAMMADRIGRRRGYVFAVA